jgi:biopolymer transport protein ExbD
MTDVNMTPLIDVSLVLVVILLLATPLAFESSFAVKRSRVSGREAATPTRDERVELTVLSADSVRVNDRAVVALADLRGTLAPLLDRSPSRLVAVDCGDSVRHGAFVQVLDTARLAGAREIAVAGR